ncbi:MAG: hypothetical protein ACE5EV_04300 [Gaiellales bacterium]
MATKKQRRRRAKVQRHEWEYVQTNEDGDEVVLDSPRTGAERAESKNGAAGPTGRRGRPLQKPTLKRVARRGAIFGPLLFVLVFVTSPNLSTAQKILQSVFLIAIFLPLSYFLDVMMYRFLSRRAERKTQATTPSRRRR